MHKLYLSRRNLVSLLSKLDRCRGNPTASACTLVKRDTEHPRYPASTEIEVTAIEDEDYYATRPAGPVHPLDVPPQ